MEPIAAQGKIAQLTSVKGEPTTLREGFVRTVEPNGTVSVEMSTGRAGVVEAQVPSWYSPALGDKVLIGELNGDPASPIVLVPRNGSLAYVTVTELDAAIAEAEANDGWEPGDLKTSARASCGAQWIGPCTGQEVLGTTYPALAEALGTGSGSLYGSAAMGYVKLPNGEGRVLMGASGTYPLGSSGGEAEVTLDVAEIPAHAHGGSTGTATVSGDFLTYVASGGSAGLATGSNVMGVGLGIPKLSISSEGGGGAHNNLQPYTTANLFIHV